MAIEDHVYHISELLRNIQMAHPSFDSHMTVVCLDHSGPDTDAAIGDWLGAYPKLQVAARIHDSDIENRYPCRLSAMKADLFQSQNAYCRFLATLVRPNGMLLQDIELETLEFIPRDRWWESTMLASTVRGIVGDRPPRCAFISNKRGYEATFGAELLAAGHDPRDVLNKYDLERVVVPFLAGYLDEQFPWQLRWQIGEPENSNCCRLNSSDAEKTTVQSELDLVVWPEQDLSIILGGKALDSSKKSRVQLAANSNESDSWVQLIQAKLDGQPGLPVQTVGERVAPAGALKAETTNAAARHIHNLRKRLSNPQGIVTVEGHYSLRNDLKVGLVMTKTAGNN